MRGDGNRAGKAGDRRGEEKRRGKVRDIGEGGGRRGSKGGLGGVTGTE